MCGLVGFFDRRGGLTQNRGEALACRMADALLHRGPDDGGVWSDPERGLVLGHRRLSIVDLSTAGHQPMVSASGRAVIAYNGEIYNFAELRCELEAEGIVFRSHTDTEVILEACEHWGVDRTIPKLIGMFAIALWNRRTGTLTLVRDRLGKKPLYWSEAGDILLFGSELKALRRHPACPTEIDRDAVAAFMRYGYVPGPHSIYRGVHKLRPGCILTVMPDRAPVESSYWSLAGAVRAGGEAPLDLSDAEAADQLDALLRDAVGRRMIADVPLGAFLSGGIDSSAVVAQMQAQSARPIKTFSIGFHEAGYNEAQHAKQVAAHLGTEHHELYVDDSHARDVVPLLPRIFDEPFADSSQIPTFLVAEMTRRHVTVALSGDGGDELFAGYSRYNHTQHVWRRLGCIPMPARRVAAWAILSMPPVLRMQLLRLLSAGRPLSAADDKLERLARVLRGGPDELYRHMVSQWLDPERVTLGSREPHGLLFDSGLAQLLPDRIARMQYVDSLTYLPDDILTKVDRASMAVSLEARTPLLDHRVVEFAWRLPMNLKIRDGKTKWLLRQVLHRYVPRDLVERPKVGFRVPIGAWLCGPLRDWAESLLAENRLAAEGMFDPKPIRGRWQEHLSGVRDWHSSLWGVLMFQSWLEYQKVAAGDEEPSCRRPTLASF